MEDIILPTVLIYWWKAALLSELLKSQAFADRKKTSLIWNPPITSTFDYFLTLPNSVECISHIRSEFTKCTNGFTDQNLLISQNCRLLLLAYDHLCSIMDTFPPPCLYPTVNWFVPVWTCTFNIMCGSHILYSSTRHRRNKGTVENHITS